MARGYNKNPLQNWTFRQQNTEQNGATVTAETSVARTTGQNYFFALFSAFSIFLTNFLGFLSKSFLQSLQQSLISRS